MKKFLIQGRVFDRLICKLYAIIVRHRFRQMRENGVSKIKDRYVKNC